MSFRWTPESGPARQVRRKVGRGSGRSRTTRRRPQLDWLEDRTLLSTSIPLNSATWTSLGPAGITSSGGWNGGNGGPSSGKIEGIATDPTNPQVIYIASSGGGVWKTTDAGASWAPLTDNQSTLVMGSIAVASDSRTIYAGTGSPNHYSLDNYAGIGILKSTNAGRTWSVVGGVFAGRSVTKVVVDPTNPNTVYAAVANATVYGRTGATGIFKSVDGGNTWTNTSAVAGIDTTQDYTDLVMDPTNPLNLYAAIGTMFGSAVNGVYKSVDGGAHWAPAGNFPSGVANGRIALAIGKSDPKTLLASVADPATNGLKYLLKSSDSGATWSNLTSVGNYLGTQGWYDNVVAISPTDANTMFAAGQALGFTSGTVFETTDGGNTWTDITKDSQSNQPHSDEHAAAFDASGRLLLAGDGGIWRLQNANPANLRWASINSNLQITQFIGVGFDPRNPNVLVGGAQDNGTSVFNDSLTWKQTFGGDGGYAGIDPNNDQTMYTTYVNVDFERSDDGGRTWNQKITGLNTGDPVNFYAPWAMDPSNTNHLLFGTNKLYTTASRGDSWTVLATPGTNGFNPNGNKIKSIAVAPSDPKTIYVVTNASEVFVSTDGGTNWTSRAIPGGGNGLANVVVDPKSPTTAYVTRDAISGPRLFETTDGGATWQDLTGNLPVGIPAVTFALDPRTPGRAFLGTAAGVYFTTDGGGTWAQFKSGMPNARVNTLVLDTATNILMAGTYGRGVFEIYGTDSISLLPGPLSGVEGVAMPATDAKGTLVATFIDSSGMLPTSSYTPVIDWGDGSATAVGTVVDEGDGTYGIYATHTYPEEGTYRVSVVITSSTGESGKLGTNLTIGDAPLHPTGLTISPTEGAAYTGPVASFIDDNPNAPASDFTASIDWGDGHITAGTVTPDGQGGWIVSGTNTYARTQAYPVNVTVKDVGGQSFVVTSSAAVVDAPLVPVPVTFTALAGTAFTNKVIASFRDPAPGNVATDYTVSVDWGDGSPVVTLPPSALRNAGTRWDIVSGHTYKRFGTYQLHVSVIDYGGATADVASTAVVADATITASGQTFTATEGKVYNGPVASYISSNAFAQAGDFAPPAIDWGDNSGPDTGRVVALGGGRFAVYGTHTYGDVGTFQVSAAVNSLGTSTTQAGSQAVVLDAPLIISPIDLSAPAGVNVRPADPSVPAGAVASFIDTFSGGQVGDFTASIDWGDGTQSAGQVAQPGGAGTEFYVTGSHAYNRPQDYDVTVTVSDKGNPYTGAPATAHVTDPDFTVTALDPTRIPVLTEGNAYGGALGSFTTSSLIATPSDFVGSIDWGDGTVTGAVLSPLGLVNLPDPNNPGQTIPAAQFAISSATPHAYTEESAYPFPITLRVTSLGGTAKSDSTQVTVNDAPIIGVPVAPIQSTVGATVGGMIGSFTEYAAAPVSDFSAQVTWPDGTTTPATVTAGPNGTFLVSSSAVMSRPGNQQAVVTITDVGNPGHPGQFTVGLDVADVPMTAAGSRIAAVQGGTYSGPVATFSQSNPYARPSEYVATINWGDGTRTAGVITGSNGQYTVSGSHLFRSAAAAQPLSVTISHVVGGVTYASATASGSAHVLRPASGAMSPLSDNGVSNVDGITTVRNPVFLGKAEPGTTLRLYAAPTSNPGAARLVGSATADKLGNWAVQISPLGDGSYVVNASMLDTATGLSTPSIRLATGTAGGPLVVSNTGPTVAGVMVNPAAGLVSVVYQTGPAWMNFAAAANPANYSLAVPSGTSGLQPLTPMMIGLAFGPNHTLVANLTYGAGRISPGSYVLTLHAAGLTDLAGNRLVEKRLVTFPQSTNSPNPDYVAQLDVGAAGLVAAPHQYVSLAEQMAASNYARLVQAQKVVRVPNIRAASVPARSFVPQGPSAFRRGF